MNSLNLFGRLTRNPVLRKTANGNDSCYFTLAVPRPIRKKDAETQKQTADFIPCVVYMGAANIIMQYLKKGDRLAVTGRLQSYLADTNEGLRSRQICVIDKFDFAGMPPKPEESHEEATVDMPPSGVPDDVVLDHVPDEDIPF